MKKRQAHEVIADIEAKWKKRCRCMLWSWSFEHLNFLVQRWAFKNPQDKERREHFVRQINEQLERRFNESRSMSWLYFCTADVREMMMGAGMNTSEPKWRESVPDDNVIYLTSEQRRASDETIEAHRA